MASETINRIRLGIFVTVGTILLVTGLYFLGNKKNMFSRSVYVHTYFENISGLRPGNNVRFSGIDIGTVDEIEIKSPQKILVSMVIDAKVSDYIKVNSIAMLGTDGLMGNRLVNIEPGIDGMRNIVDGDTIPSREIIDTDEMMAVLDRTNRNISRISEDLVKVTGNISSSKSTLYSVLVDTTLATELHTTLSNISVISQNLKSFSNDLSDISKDVKEGKGVLGSITEDSSDTHRQLQHSIRNILEISDNLNSFSAKLNNTMDSIQRSRGSLSILLYDTTVAGEFKSSMTNIDSVAGELPAYMNALKDNFLFRKYFRKQEKKR